MTINTLNFLKSTCAELDVALAHERRRPVIKRLRAVRLVLSGTSVFNAAMAVRADVSSVKRWADAVREFGCAVLTSPTVRKKEGSDIDGIREAIQAALQRDLTKRCRVRLLTIDATLGGLPAALAAEHADVSVTTVRSWVSEAMTGGIKAECVRRHSSSSPMERENPFKLSAAEFRKLATTESNPRTKRRLFALAHIAAGAPYKTAGKLVNASETTVGRWVRAFQAGGIAVLRDDTLGRPKSKRTRRKNARR